MYDFSGKRIVITGASSGIGLGVLEQLAKISGTQIVAVARRLDSVTALGLENVYTYAADVSDADGVDGVIDFATQKMGGIDVFYANAGFAYYEKMGEANWEHIEKIYALNVFSPIYSLQKLANAGQPLEFIVTCSAVAKCAIPGFSLYDSTKAALDSFMHAYAFEKSSNINLHTVYPVATKTNFFKVAADAAPVPFPAQSTQDVVRAVISGIKKGKRYIYPLAGFGFFNWLWNFLPFLKSAYNANEDRKFKDWLQKQHK